MRSGIGVLVSSFRLLQTVRMARAPQRVIEAHIEQLRTLVVKCEPRCAPKIVSCRFVCFAALELLAPFLVPMRGL